MAGALIISLAALALSLPSPGGGAPAALRVGAAVELWHQGALHVGNFRGRADGSKGALMVELSDGAAIKVDGGQIIDVWEVPAAESGAVPTTTAAWAQLHQQASTMLTELPPHMLDLRPLWQRLLNEKGVKKKRINSDRVAQDLFRSPHTEQREPDQARRRQSEDVAAVSVTRLAQRLAAAQLLSEERTLFKRIPADVKPAAGGGGGDGAQGSAADGGGSDGGVAQTNGAGDTLLWTAGGFKALPRATASSAPSSRWWTRWPVSQRRARRQGGQGG